MRTERGRFKFIMLFFAILASLREIDYIFFTVLTEKTPNREGLAMDPTDIPQGRLYTDLSHLMRIISPPADYAEEAAHWRTVLREKLGPGRHNILELGVGGGHNLSHLTADFAAAAVDLSEAMLAECGRLNPGVELHQGDMRSVRLGRKFAAVLIHDAISYMLTQDDLLAAFRTAAAHLEPGGVFITSPDRFAEDFRGPETGQYTNAVGDMQVTYMEYVHDPDPSDTTLEMLFFYLIKERGRLRIEHDRHMVGIFPRQTWLSLLQEAGFAAKVRAFRLSGRERPYELLVGVLA